MNFYLFKRIRSQDSLISLILFLLLVSCSGDEGPEMNNSNQIPNTPQQQEETVIEEEVFTVEIDESDLSILPKDTGGSLIAFDDENGIGIESESIKDYRLKEFLQNGTPIHYEKMFMTDEVPARVVYWAHSKTRGWAERHEIKIEQ